MLGEFGARWKKELPEAVEVLERGFGAATPLQAAANAQEDLTPSLLQKQEVAQAA